MKPSLRLPAFFVLIFSLLVAGFPMLSKAQTDSSRTRNALWAFRQGKAQLQMRYFFMETRNEGALPDAYSHALGGGIHYETGSFYGFQAGVGVFSVFNLASSDLTLREPGTGQPNRYEIGQFDLLDPTAKKDMNRLEEAFLRYKWRETSLSFGRMVLKTPFLNPQDGRMRPTAESGFWLESKALKNLDLQAGFLNAISPRSTFKWFRVGDSFGIYPTGLAENGQKSAYARKVQSDFVALLGLQYNWKGKARLRFWDVVIDNVSQTFLLQADNEGVASASWAPVWGLQWIRQDQIGNGGNANPALAYVSDGWKSNVFGARLGLRKGKWETSLNYTRITAEGRYLFPREWGRDPFFTFMPRERNEGAGDVHAFVVRSATQLEKAQLRPELGLGYFRMPDVKNARLNKYGMPSYFQLNASLKYEFAGPLKGLETDLLVVYKRLEGETYGNLAYVYNKVNMWQINAVLNWRF
jgi:hypothetical protein